MGGNGWKFFMSLLDGWTFFMGRLRWVVVSAGIFWVGGEGRWTLFMGGILLM